MVADLGRIETLAAPRQQCLSLGGVHTSAMGWFLGHPCVKTWPPSSMLDVTCVWRLMRPGQQHDCTVVCYPEVSVNLILLKQLLLSLWTQLSTIELRSWVLLRPRGE